MVQRMVIGLRYGHGMVFGQGKLGNRGFQPERLARGLEVGSIRRIQGIGYGILEFLGVGTTFDIFQNIHILYFSIQQYWTSSGLWVLDLLSFCGLWCIAYVVRVCDPPFSKMESIHDRLLSTNNLE
ncbi:hypothetical protein Tco_0003515 [Tanacetum coccineum]